MLTVNNVFSSLQLIIPFAIKSHGHSPKCQDRDIWVVRGINQNVRWCNSPFAPVIQSHQLSQDFTYKKVMKSIKPFTINFWISEFLTEFLIVYQRIRWRYVLLALWNLAIVTNSVFKPLRILTKSFILDVWLGFESVPVIHEHS